MRPTRAKRKSSTTCGRTARRSLVRCTRRPAAAIPAETVDALWNLAWQGLVTNDTFHALRAFTRVARRRPRRQSRGVRRRPRERVSIAASRPAIRRRTMGAGADRAASSADATRWAAAIAQQLLARHGVVTREGVAAESIPGGFGSVYPVLKAMEETGRLRRGYFVAGLGATQFALAGRARSAALAPRLGWQRHARRGRPRGDRSREPVRRHVEMAVTTTTDPLNTQNNPGSAGSASSALNVVGGTAADAAGARRARSVRR